MRKLRDLPIGHKLSVIVLVTTTLALVMACLTILLRDVDTARDSMRIEFARLAEIVGTNCTPTLHFYDPQSAEQIMAALSSEPSIDRAVLTTPGGEEFAVYMREGFEPQGIFVAPSRQGFVNGRFFLSHPIIESGQHIGTLHFEANLTAISQRIRRDLIAVVAILAISLVLANLIAQRLKRIVSEPISRLADTALDVSLRHDYSVRANKHGEDELGLLVDSFNAMLARVEERDSELRRHGATLEEKVRERTARLQTINEELHEAKEAAEESSRLKSDFVANMSHELRTPMNAIIGMTNLTLESNLSADQSEMLSIVATSADSLLNLLNDILDFSKIEAKGIVLGQEPFEPRLTISHALRSLAEQAHSKNLELLCEIDPAVPTRTIGDSARLRQVIINLIGNAIKFTEEGQVLFSARLEEADAGGRAIVHFEVADTGCGIPEDKQELIFESFTQADGSLTRSHGGTGLGLSISKELVGLMGGRIWVESQSDEGSVFHFTAGFDRVDEEASAASLDELAGVRALVVDDNPTNQRITSAMLDRWGLRSSVVADGGAALALLRREAAAGDPFRLVFLDASMPEMNGFEVAREIRKHKALSLTSIVMLSSLGRRDQQDPTTSGVSAHLVKPVFEADLLAVVQSTLGTEVTTESVTAQPQRAGAAPDRPLRILVAEDNYMNQRLLEAILGRQGHEVVLATNGVEALAAHELETFDLILMDVQMPKLGGLEATLEIRRREAARGVHTPIVALTANAMKGDREQCLEAGADEYIAKPLNKQELFRVMEELCFVPAPASEEPAPEVTVRADLKVFNLDTTLALCDNDFGFVSEVVGLFLESSIELVGSLSEAVAGGEPSSVHIHAHTLKGAASNLGAERLEAAARRLMNLSRGGNFEESAAALSVLRAQYAQLVTELTTFLDLIESETSCAS